MGPLTWMIAAAAVAATRPCPTEGLGWMSPGLAAVSASDTARYAGDRPLARDCLELALTLGEPVAEGMARLRLLTMSGNLGPIQHGAKITEALNQGVGPWGWLAWADYYLFAPEYAGADRALARSAAEQAALWLPGPAAARLYLATGERRHLDLLRVSTQRDGLGDALVAADGVLPGQPSTWFLGLGLAGAPGVGFGGGLVFTHPDLLLRGGSAQLSLTGTTRGAYAVSARLRSPGPVFGVVGGAAGRGVVDVYTGDTPTRVTQDLVALSGGGGVRDDGRSAQLTWVTRWDAWGEGWLAGHGPSLNLGLDRSAGFGETREGFVIGLSTDAALVGYPHWGVSADLRGYRPGLGGVTAARVWVGAELMKGAPVLRLPTVGGAELHRGAWAGRYRAPLIGTVDLEQRWALIGPLEGVVFGNLAYVLDDGLHPAGGLGLRLILPPERLNVVRVDVAVSDSAWAITTGWGEAF
ncbi:hypothetical protein L6R49_26970 [Myxococcota bacterium]|nr:hypothetical protein [Myxococcota bacterium]